MPHMVRAQVRRAFGELARLGYFTRMNFWCCQSCAWAAIPPENKKVVFFHRQDAAQLRKTGTVYLAWCGNAFEIIQILRHHNLKVAWNGQEGSRLLVEGKS